MKQFALDVEALGLDGLGIADSPKLHGATYPVVQHLLTSTRRISVGPFVTNPVTRHPSVHAADLDALDSLFPDRVFFGVGAGDSAVTSVGLKPASPDAIAQCVSDVHERVGSRVPVLMAVGGLRSAAATPPGADGVILGGGIDPVWSAELVEAAENSAGHRLARWGFLVSSLGPPAQIADRRDAVLGSVLTVAQHALSGDMCRKGVPEDLVDGFRSIFARYQVRLHGSTAGANHDLLTSYPDHCRYLLDRLAVIDVADDTVHRLASLASDLSLEGFFLSATVPDQSSHARHIAEDLLPRLL